MKNFLQVQSGIGLALAIPGMTVMLGWLLRNAAMVQFLPSAGGIGFNTALCFTLAGFAFTLKSLDRRWASAARTAAGWILTGFALVILYQNKVHGHSGIDFPSLQSWFDPNDPQPGRMALITCAGFLLCGLALALTQRVRHKAQGIAIQIATYSVLALGLIGVVGYWLDFGLLYPQFHRLRMPLHTAVGMLLAGIGLWTGWYRAAWYRSGRFFSENEKLAYQGTAILTMVALSAAMAGLSAQEATLKRTVNDHLAGLLRNRVNLFQELVREKRLDSAAAANRVDLVRSMQVLRDDPENLNALVQLQETGNSILSAGAAAITVYDMNNREIMESGRFSRASAIAARLGDGQTSSRLFWNGGFYLNSYLPITDQDEIIGFIEIERSLPLLTGQLSEMKDAAHTVQIAMCVAQPDHFWCFPLFFDSSPFRIPRQSPPGQPLAMDYAAKGQSGLFNGPDHNGQNNIAAYAPVANSGLVVVAQQSVGELYRPIHMQLALATALLLAFIAGYAWLLRSRIMPLAARLLLSERSAREQVSRNRMVADHVGEGIITLNPDGAIESFNNAATRILGYSEEEAVGKKSGF